MTKLSSIFIPVILLSGCATDPYSIIEGGRSSMTDRNSYDVIISGVDGKKYFKNEKTKYVDPGPHRVELTSTKLDRGGDVTYKSWYFKAEPCKRYVVAAKHSKNQQFSNKHWEVDLVRVEPIPSCERILDNKK